MNDSIVIVACGAVLPGALGVEEVWKRLCTGTPEFTTPSPSRWNTAAYVKDLPKLAAGMVSDEILAEIRSADASRENWVPGSLFCAAAADEIRRSLPKDFFRHLRSLAVILGTMGEDAQVSRCYFQDEREVVEKVLPELRGTFDDLEKTLPDRSQQSVAAFLSAIEQGLGNKARSFVVDSACASSLTSLDVGVKLLLRGEADAVVVGGMDSRVSPQNFLSFRNLGLLSDGRCLPFDGAARGIVPGEGAVLFLMTTEKTAKQYSLSVWGHVDVVEGASNGSTTSMFAPSSIWGAEVLKRAWGNEVPDYLECHGTGTVLGDSMELQALESAFPGEIGFPIGSAKAVFGHTLGAAGAVGILKALLILKHRQIPAVHYLEKPLSPTRFPIPRETKIFEKDQPLRVGVSSSGFGGSVYHVILSNQNTHSLKLAEKTSEIVCVAFEEKTNGEIADLAELYELKIPPAAIRFTDPGQIAAVVLSQSAFSRSLLFLDDMDKSRISVVSSGQIASIREEEVVRRIQYEELIYSNPQKAASLRQCQNRYVGLNEEVATAIHAALSGRLAMFWDLHGKTFHVVAGERSSIEARAVAERELESGNSDVVLCYYEIEELSDEVVQSRRLGAGLKVLCTKELAQKKGWPVLSEAHP